MSSASSSEAGEDQPLFLYDLGSSWCYLAAETVMSALGAVPEWEPLSGAALGLPAEAMERREVERRADELGLQPVRWPPIWPPDAERAAWAATYAKTIGRAVAFSLAAFRQVFAGGRDLGDESTVLIAGAACEIHPRALLGGTRLRATRRAWQHAHDRARRLGVSELPAIAAGGHLFQGPSAVAEAATRLG